MRSGERQAETGQQLKLFGQEQVERHYVDWVLVARQVAVDICIRHGSVTSDDIHKECPPPPGTHPNAMGAVFRKGFQRLGYCQTKRKDGHARMISIWGLG